MKQTFVVLIRVKIWDPIIPKSCGRIQYATEPFSHVVSINIQNFINGINNDVKATIINNRILKEVWKKYNQVK